MGFGTGLVVGLLIAAVVVVIAVRALLRGFWSRF